MCPYRGYYWPERNCLWILNVLLSDSSVLSCVNIMFLECVPLAPPRLPLSACDNDSFPLEGTTSACSCEMILCLDGYPVPSLLLPCWAPTLCSQSSGTTIPMNVGMTTLVSSALRQTTRKNWKIKWSSCTRATGWCRAPVCVHHGRQVSSPAPILGGLRVGRNYLCSKWWLR